MLSVLGVVVTFCVCVCECCIFSQVSIVAVFSVCNSDEPSVCCMCGYI